MLLNIKQFLEAHCPALFGKTLSINYLGQGVGAVGLFATGAAPVIRQFADGGGLYGYEFSVALRTAFDNDGEQAIENFNLLEEVSNFLEQAEENGMLPTLSAGMQPRGFSIKSRPAPASNNTKTAKLQMVCSLLYEKEGCKH